MQNPLPDHDVACVSFVISASSDCDRISGTRRGDDDAQAMVGGYHPRCEPQIDVILVDTARLEERGPVEAVAETRTDDDEINGMES